MKNPNFPSALVLACCLSAASAQSAAIAQDTPLPKDSLQYGQWETGAGEKGEPVGGQPPKGAKPSIGDFDYELNPS